MKLLNKITCLILGHPDLKFLAGLEWRVVLHCPRCKKELCLFAPAYLKFKENQEVLKELIDA